MIIYDVLPQLTVLDDTPIRLPERMSGFLCERIHRSSAQIYVYIGIPERSQSSRGYYHDVPIDVSPVPSRLVKEFPPTVPETCEDVVPPSIRSPTPPRPPTQFTKNEPHNASPQISSKAVVDTQRPKTSFELHLKSLKTPRPPSSLPPPLNFRGGFPTILPKPPLIPPINSQKSPAIGKRQFVVCKVTDAALEEPRNWTPTPPSGPPRIPNSNSNSSPSRIQRIHTRTIIAAEERLIDLN